MLQYILMRFLLICILTTSTNYVVRITKEDVITAQGSFYPFEEAHELYLHIPDGKTDVIFSGYSRELDSKIVITTFARRNVCIILAIPQLVRADIYSSSIALYNMLLITRLL